MTHPSTQVDSLRHDCAGSQAAVPTVTIMINNFNYGAYLDRAIRSALQQSYGNVEVVVVDDGSTDNSREVIRSYGDRIVAVLKPNGGQASAFNAAFRHSTGEWVCFLDSDDWFEEQKVTDVLRYISSFPAVGLVAHNVRYCNADSREIEFADGVTYGSMRLIDERRYMRQGKVRFVLPATSAIVAKREMLSQILPMPEDIHITADNYIKIVALSLAPVLLIPDQLANQRIHGTNAYTGLTHSREKLLKQCYIGSQIAFHLKSRFPHLSRLAWKQYGRTVAELSADPAADASRLLSQIQRDYSPFEYSPLCCMCVASAYVKASIRRWYRHHKTVFNAGSKQQPDQTQS